MKRDSEIQQAVLLGLSWDTRVDETEIHVQVDNGIVTLTGVVESCSERTAAQEAAHRVDGVLNVANHVRVRDRGVQSPADTEIARVVRETLEWHSGVPHDCIRITVTGGWVTLEGAVDCWHERENAELAIRHLSCVKGVVNQLEVAPPIVAPTSVGPRDRRGAHANEARLSLHPPE